MKNKIKELLEKIKKDKDYQKKLKELKKKDPFIYKNFQLFILYTVDYGKLY